MLLPFFMPIWSVTALNMRLTCGFGGISCVLNTHIPPQMQIKPQSAHFSPIRRKLDIFTCKRLVSGQFRSLGNSLINRMEAN